MRQQGIGAVHARCSDLITAALLATFSRQLLCRDLGSKAGLESSPSISASSKAWSRIYCDSCNDKAAAAGSEST